MVKFFDPDQFHLRNKVEKGESFLKGILWESLKIPKYRLQNKMIKTKGIHFYHLVEFVRGSDCHLRN